LLGRVLDALIDREVHVVPVRPARPGSPR
jgi:hypothetical protein